MTTSGYKNAYNSLRPFNVAPLRKSLFVYLEMQNFVDGMREDGLTVEEQINTWKLPLE